jgi:hypothetical protein
LKEEEVALFLEYCDADPKARLLEKSNNKLVLLDFLLLKHDMSLKNYKLAVLCLFYCFL